MGKVPQFYRTAADFILTNYNFTDIVEGTGIGVFDGFQTVDSTGTLYKLGVSPVYTAIRNTPTTAYESNDENLKKFDIDFDLADFNTQRTVSGTGRIIFTGYTKYGGGASGSSSYFIVKVKKVSGSTETVIGTVQTATNTVDNTPKLYVLNVALTQESFNVGDFIRLTIEAWGLTSPAGVRTLQMVVCTDPRNADNSPYSVPSTDSTTSRLIFMCPFLIEN